MAIRRPQCRASGCDGERPAARRGAAAHGGERRRAAVKGLGCPKRRGICTRTSASTWRNHWRPSRAATATDDGARRAAAAVNLRRRRAGDAEHGGTIKPHRRVSYLTADPRSNAGRRTAAARARSGGADRGGGGAWRARVLGRRTRELGIGRRGGRRRLK
jgi:hypothetical protein